MTWQLVANAKSGKAFREGARLEIGVVSTIKRTKVYCRGLSHGGRKIVAWLPLERCQNIRVAWTHEPFGSFYWGDKERAAEWVQALSERER